MQLFLKRTTRLSRRSNSHMIGLKFFSHNLTTYSTGRQDYEFASGYLWERSDGQAGYELNTTTINLEHTLPYWLAARFVSRRFVQKLLDEPSWRSIGKQDVYEPILKKTEFIPIDSNAPKRHYVAWLVADVADDYLDKLHTDFDQAARNLYTRFWLSILLLLAIAWAYTRI